MAEPFRTVLCPVDFTSLSERTVVVAAELCRRMKSRLVLHHNLGPRPPGYLSVNWMVAEEDRDKHQQHSEEVPDKLRRLMKEIPEGVPCEAKLTHGPLDVAVLEVARLLPADLLVMGSHGWSNAEHRSLTEVVILKAPCTVFTTGESCDPVAWFSPRGQRPEQLKVLLPVDFSKRTRAQVDFGFAMGRWMPHELHLLHVVPEDAPEAVREAALSRLDELVPEDLRERVVTDVRAGRPARCIVEAQQDETVLFVLLAAHRKGPLRRLLFGATTLEVLHQSTSPVWFVPESWRPAAAVASKQAAAGGSDGLA